MPGMEQRSSLARRSFSRESACGTSAVDVANCGRQCWQGGRPYGELAMAIYGRARESLDRWLLRPVRIGVDETVAVRHLLLRQVLRVHHIVFADDAVEVEDVGGDGIDLLVLQGERRGERHRPPDVV